MGAGQWSNYVKNYNPDEPRDDHGRWTTGGASNRKPNDGRVLVADSRPFDTRTDASDGTARPDGQQVAISSWLQPFIPSGVERNVKSVLSNVTNGTLSSDEINDLYDEIIDHIERKDAELFANINPNSAVITLNDQQFHIVEQQIDAVEDPALRAKAQAGLDQALANGKVRVRK